MLSWLGSLEFRDPWLILLAVAALPVFWLARRAPGRVQFSSFRLLPGHAGSWRTRLAWLPDMALALAAVALALALAGPRIGEQFRRIEREGIAIMMVLDTSGSMQALDLSEEDRERTRLEAVQDVFEQFVLGGGGLAGRPDDAIGVIGFARYADTVCPLTLDHTNVAAVARSLEIVSDRSEDGTAIGDALGLAVERLRKSPAHSRIALLLTDGVNNAGVESPAAAAELAKTQGVRVYTIGAGTTGFAPVRVLDPFSGRQVLRSFPVEVDEATLKEIAKRTGGQYFRATDAEGLEQVYRAIDRLERTKITEERSRQYREFFSLPLALGLALASAGWLARGALFPEVALMSGLTFAGQGWIHLVWAAVVLVAALVVLELRARDTLGQFISETMQVRLAERQTLARRLTKLGLILATLLLGTVGLMRPQVSGGREVRSARNVIADIMVVLDVSRSMLAEDAAPNRLARAKAEIGEFVERVSGHRIGLVVFAGRASVQSPLTSDYGFFHLVLRDVDSRSVSRGGTRIGEAIRKATAAFGPARGAPRVMLLITDGEDHDSYPLDAARDAVEAGIRIVAIGFGSEEGSEITLTDPQTGARTTLADRDGLVVRSRLDGELLREIALATEGVYVPAGTSALDLDSIVEAHVEPLVTDSAVRRERPVVVEHYRWFVLGALIALVAAVWVGSTSGARRAEA